MGVPRILLDSGDVAEWPWLSMAIPDPGIEMSTGIGGCSYAGKSRDDRRVQKEANRPMNG